MDVKIPFLGDGIESANVVSILVKPGDSVEFDQTLLELETDKATAPVPSTSSGVIDSILINEGDVVKEGMSVVKLKDTGENVSIQNGFLTAKNDRIINLILLRKRWKQYMLSVRMPNNCSLLLMSTGNITPAKK